MSAAMARPCACARRRSPRAKPRAPKCMARPAPRSCIRSTIAPSSRDRPRRRSSCWRKSPISTSIVAPVGGGGLLSGTAIAAKSMRPGIAVHGAEPANADDAARSLASGRVEPAAQADDDRRRPAHDARRRARCRAARARHLDRARHRGRHRARDADDLGADEDRDRAVVRGAARMPARAHARLRAAGSASS